MNKTVRLLIVPMAALGANVALAADAGFYVGLGAGQSHYKNWASSSDIQHLQEAYGATLGVDDFDGFTHSTSENSAVGYRIFAGYTINDWLAVEASYLDAGKVEAYSTRNGTFYDAIDNSLTGELAATASAQTSALTLDMLVSVPLGPLEVFGKVGAYSARTDLALEGYSSISADHYRYSDSADAADFHYGAGIRFDVAKALGFRAEWERLYAVEANHAESDVDLLSASLTFHF